MNAQGGWRVLYLAPAWCARWLVLGLLYTYRACISPLFPSCCRFQPSCSVYAVQAIRCYGLLKGGGLTVKRLCRCHPWARAGYDPLPLPNHTEKETV